VAARRLTRWIIPPRAARIIRTVEENSMGIRIVRLGTQRTKVEGLRIGTVR
jgi:hypothetical protein